MNIDKKIEKSQLLINKEKEEKPIVEEDTTLGMIFIVMFLLMMGYIITHVVLLTFDHSSELEMHSDELKLQKKIEYLKHEHKVQETIDFLKEVNQIKEIAANVTTQQLTGYIEGKVDEVEFDRLLLLHGKMQFLKNDSGENLAEKINLHDEIKHLHGLGKFQILFDLEADGILQENSK